VTPEIVTGRGLAYGHLRPGTILRPLCPYRRSAMGWAWLDGGSSPARPASRNGPLMEEKSKRKAGSS
jgi:hypothetical protein